MPHSYSFRHMVRLVWTVGLADFSLKYRGSVLGYVWSLLGPLTKFAVIYTVFSPYVEADIPVYPLYLFLGIIIWEHFAYTTNGCMNVLHEKAGFIQKMAFPREVLIYIVGWTNFLVFLTHMLLFTALMVLFRVSMGWSVLYAVILCAQMTMLATGIGMLLASYALRYRDIPHLWSVATQVLFWLTPIMYHSGRVGTVMDALREVPGIVAEFSVRAVVGTFIRLQPLSVIIDDARRVFLAGESPSALHALWVTAVCGGVFWLALQLFRRRSVYFVQEY